MSRNLIQRPRFFIDFPQYWRTKGIFSKAQYGYNDHIDNDMDEPIDPTLFGLEFNNQFETTAPAGEEVFDVRIWLNGDSETGTSYYNSSPMEAVNELNQINYCAIFGHNFNTENLVVIPKVFRGQESSTSVTAISADNLEEVFNCNLIKPGDLNDNYCSPIHNGTSIFKFNGWKSELTETDATGQTVGAVQALRLVFRKKDGSNFTGNEIISFSGVSFGRTYTLPRSPDLKTSIAYDYGIKSQQSIDGTTFEQIDWLEPKKLPTGLPAFYVNDNYEPNLDYNTNYLQGEDRNMITATGRRTWTMKFTALANTDVFPGNRMESFYADSIESGSETNGGYDAAEFVEKNSIKYFNKNISTDTSLYSMLLNRTLGGSLPMIYQSFTDASGYGDNNSGEFALVKLGSRGLQFNIQSFNTYNVGLTVRESW